MIDQIRGDERPEPALVNQAHALSTSLASFQQELELFLRDEALRRPAEAQAIARLRLATIALFPGRAEDEPDTAIMVFAGFQLMTSGLIVAVKLAHMLKQSRQRSA